MKKSKFLKKSLAMLLALMLVVAMIPLSASALENRVPELTSATVTVNQGTAVAVAAKDKTFTVDVTSAVEEVKVEASLGYNATLQFKSVDGVSHVAANADVDLDTIEHSVSGTTTTIPLLVRSEDKNSTVEYTLVINKTDKGTTTDIASVSVPKADASGVPTSIVYDASLDKANKEITVRIPRGTTSTSKALINVTAADNATITGGTDTTYSAGQIDFDDAANVATTTTATFTVTSQSGNNVATWTINIVRVDALSGISVAGVEGVFSDADGNGDNDTITVTLPVSAITDADGDLIPDPELVVAYTTQPDTAITLNTAASGTGGTDATLVNGKKFKFTGLEPATDFNTTPSQNLKLTCKAESNCQTYALIVKIEESSDADVVWAQLDTEIATVGENTITAELPATSFAANVANVEVTVRTAPTAQKVEITNMATGTDKFVKTNTGTELKDGYAEWRLKDSAGSSDSTVNLTNGAVLTVTSEEGYTKNYTVTATKATNVDEATLSTVTLVTASGTKYEGNIVGKTITFKVPYMTTLADINSWKVYATACAGANVKDGTLTDTVVSGVTTGTNAFDGLDAKLNGGEDVTYSDAIVAVNKTNPDVFKKYDVVFDFAEAAKGNTISELYTVSSTQSGAKAVSDDANDDNTDKAVVDDAKDTITITTAASLKTVPHYVSKMTTATGAVALMYNSDVNKVVVLDRKTLGTVLANNDEIVVLPEALAKKVLTGTTTINSAADLKAVATTDNAGTVYTVKFAEDKALNDSSIKSISVGGVKLSVAADGTISGTIPYSATTDTTPVNSTDNVTDDDLNAQFLTFELGKYAKLSYKNAVPTTHYFTNAGDTDNDDEAEGYSATNLQIIFVRDTSSDENRVIPYIAYANNQFGSTATVDNMALTVYSEEAVVKGSPATTADTKTFSTYKFDLTYADPSSEAVISSFKLGNTSGSINDRVITVNMPFGSDLTALVPTFTTSIGAEVTLGGSKVISGKTVLNFTSDVTLKVTSEDGSKTSEYTVKVKVSEQFSDVQPGAWYYDNVMRAVELGILSGYTDGTFRPMNNITRRDFAIMLAQALGNSNDNDGTAVSRFPDVADDDYGVVSINYLYDNEITVGDEKGNFNPDANITRQEAAIFLAKAFEVTGTTSETFTDDAKIASWAKSFVYAAKAAGLMNGDVNGAFRPTDKLTRAEAASVMVNAVDK